MGAEKRQKETEASGTDCRSKHETEPDSSQVNTKPPTKGLLTSVPTPWYIISSFQWKIAKHDKSQGNAVWRKKQVSEAYLDMIQIC